MKPVRLKLIIEMAAFPGSPQNVEIETHPDIAPKHVTQFLTLVDDGFYDGLPFHRVIDGHVAQTGDRQGDGFGESDLGPLDAEFSDTPFARGSIGMARGEEDNSGDCQFFICMDDRPQLTGKFTQFARVTKGMDIVDRITRINVTEHGDDPTNADHIVTISRIP